MPRLSVVMPVHNAERFVAQATESVLAQTLRDFEFIAIDDESTDRSPEILERFAARDPRLRLFSRSRQGLVVTLNEGIALARAPLIARMDADDLSNPDRFERQVDALDHCPMLVAIGSRARVIDEHGNGLGDFLTPLTHEEIEDSHLRGCSAIHHPSVIYRTSVVRQLGGYRDLVPCEDFDLWLRLGEVGRLANVSERLITKRLSLTSLVASTLDKRQRVLQQIMADAWQRRNLPGYPPHPPHTIACRADLFRQWGKLALTAGEVRTGRRYALKAMREQPFHSSSWRLLAWAMRGR
jgi:glycosyltransferase involved in cell wall biosynthesis